MKLVERLPPRRLLFLQRLALVMGTVSALWTIWLLNFGGVAISVLGISVRSNAWSRPAIVCVVSLWIYSRLRRMTSTRPIRRPREIAASALRRWATADSLLLTAILAVAAAARFWALDFGLPHPAARPDEDAVAAIAGSFYAGNLEPPAFIYPPLFMLVLAAAMWLVFDRIPAMIARSGLWLTAPELSLPSERLLARVLSAASGVASVWLVFRIGWRLFDRTVAFIGAGFLALAFLHARDSHFGVTDIPMTFMMLAAFLAITRLADAVARKDLVIAGVLTGLAIATKYNAGLLFLPAFFAILTDPLSPPLSTRLTRIVVFGALATAAFLAVCPFAVISHDRFVADILFNSRHLAEGHGVDLGRGWMYHATTTLRYGLGVPLFAAGTAGLLMMLWREPRRGVFVGLCPIAYYLLIGSGRTVFARYILPVVPFLCLGAAYAVSTVAAWTASALSRPGWRNVMASALALAVVWPSLLSLIAFDRLIAREDTRVAARRWLEARFAPGTTMTQLGASNGRVYADYETRYRLVDVGSAPRPALIVLVSSPITGAPDVTRVAPWLERDYDLRFVRTVAAEDDRRNVYDWQDEFFVPLTGFHQDAPGPNLRIFVRRDLASPNAAAPAPAGRAQR